MTEPTYPSPEQGKDKPKDDGSASCDPSALDTLKCDTKGLQEQSAYLQQYADTSKTRREKFDKVRQLYIDARAKAVPDVKDIRAQLEHIKSQLDCLIPDDDGRRKKCLQDALKDVLAELAKCGVGTGCCVKEEDCDVSIPSGEEGDSGYKDTGDLRKRFAEIDAQTVAAEACFDKLVDEPAQIPIRVQELKTRVAALATDVGGDVAKLDLDRAYARYLVAWHDLEDIWLGFADTNAFYDCVCTALSCALRGRQALGVLTHHIAFEDCKKKAGEDACDLLKENVVDEVVAICHRRRTPKSDGEAGGAGGADQTDGGCAA
jgi:hypothetical protein